jgi:hypothetical protein
LFVERTIAGDDLIKMTAFTVYGLSLFRIVPKVGIAREIRQFVKAPQRIIPVKETSSSCLATARCVWRG